MGLFRWLGLGLLAANLFAPASFAEDMKLRYITLYDGGNVGGPTDATAR